MENIAWKIKAFTEPHGRHNKPRAPDSELETLCRYAGTEHLRNGDQGRLCVAFESLHHSGLKHQLLDIRDNHRGR